MTRAAALPMTTSTEPDGAPRVAGLDVLRGIAILGILFMNINAMGGSFFAEGLRARHLGWSGADQVAWFLREVVPDGTARCMLEMLFGVGMVILTDRAAAGLGAAAARPEGRTARTLRALFGPWAVLRGYYWRSLVLFAFGVVHLAVLMWPGDILHIYGIAAMVAFLFRRLGPKTLLALGLSLAAFQTAGTAYYLHAAQTGLARSAELRVAAAQGRPLSAADRKTLKETDATIARRAKRQAQQGHQLALDDRARAVPTGDAASWFRATWRVDGWFVLGIGEGASFGEQFAIWEAAATMLIGAALFKWGIVQGRRSRRFYLALMVVAYAAGLGMRTGRALAEMRFDDYPTLWYATYEVSRLATTVGHLSIVWLLLGTAAGARALAPFAAAGRCALSIYVGQTLICLWLLFPPFGLGLYGRMGWMALMLTAAAVDAVLLLAANLWARHFSIAPVEWAWRSIIAGQALPWRRPAARPARGVLQPA